jgi:tetratricopeptide (TPR) repeat protein
MVACGGVAIDELRRRLHYFDVAESKTGAMALWLQGGSADALAFYALVCARLDDRTLALAALHLLGERYEDLSRGATLDVVAAFALLGIERGAEEFFSSEHALFPADAHSLRVSAICSAHAEDIFKAIELYHLLMGKADVYPSDLLSLASLYIRAGNFEEMTSCLEAAARLDSSQPEVSSEAHREFSRESRLVRLKGWMAAGQFDRAREWFEGLRASDSEGFSDALPGYCSLLLKNDHYDEVQRVLENAGSVRKSLAMLNVQVKFAAAKGRNPKVALLLREAVELARMEENPAEAIAFQFRLCELQAERQPKLARREMDRAWQFIEEWVAGQSTGGAELLRFCENLAALPEATLLKEEGHVELAKSRLRAIFFARPYDAKVVSQLGNLYLQEGELDNAVEMFTCLKRLDAIAGSSALLFVRASNPSENELLELEAMARNPDIDSLARCRLLLQLAEAWEKKGNFDRAMALAIEGNEASKPSLNYDPRVHRQKCARLRFAFSESFFRERGDFGFRGAGASLPLFIVGMPRSGTTLIEQILSSHSEIFGAGESHAVPRRIANLDRWERRMGSGRCYPDSVDDLSEYEIAGIAQNLIEEYQKLAAVEKPAVRYVTDKLPHNFENIGFIKFILPLAKIVSVRRDPRDIGVSNYFTDFLARHGGLGFAYDLDWIGEHLSDHNLLMHHWHNLFPGAIYELEYEKLIEDPEREIRGLLSYLGLRWEPQLLNFHELKRTVKTASSWQVRQPIYQASKARWLPFKRYLRPLIASANRKIETEKIDDMVFLPEPGLFQQALKKIKDGDVGGAEFALRKLLHFVPGHGSANFLLGELLWHRGQLGEASAHLKLGVERCPENRVWRETYHRFQQAYREKSPSPSERLGRNVKSA